MSEKMIFCLGKGKFKSEGDGYQKKLQMFNKPITEEQYQSQVTLITAKNFKLPIAKWVKYQDLPKEKQTKESKQTDGLLITLGYKEAWEEMWSTLSFEDKNFFKTLLNFDSKIFKEITGIDVEEKSLIGKEVSVEVEGKVYKAKIIS